MATKRTPAKSATTTRKATPRKPAAPKDETPTVSLDINFEETIPSIKREGAGRTSKYGEMLDGIKERALSNSKQKVAVMTFDSQSQVTSRYASIRTAVKRRDDAEHWTVVARTVDGEHQLYVEYSENQDTAEDE